MSSLDLGDGIAVGGVDGVGGAELARPLELLGFEIDGDDLAGTGQMCALHGRDADAAAADHRHGRARFHLGALEDRADAGGDPAADERRPVEGHVRGDRDDGVLVDEHLLGERAETGELCDRRAVAVAYAGRCVGAAVGDLGRGS